MVVPLLLGSVIFAWLFLLIFVVPRKVFRWDDFERSSDVRLLSRKPSCKFLSFICINEMQCSSIFGIKCEEEYLYLRPRFPLSLTMKPVVIPWDQLLTTGTQKACYPFLPALSCFQLKNSGVTIKLKKQEKSGR